MFPMRNLTTKETALVRTVDRAVMAGRKVPRAKLLRAVDLKAMQRRLDDQAAASN